MKRLPHLYFLGIFLLAACSDNKKANQGAIVLGDSSTIITETNQEYLENYVADIQPRKTDTSQEPLVTEEVKVEPTPSTTPTPTLETKPAPTPTPPPPAPIQAATNGKGVTINFKEITVFFPNIEVRSFKNQNASTLNGVSYQLAAGKLVGNHFTLKGATVTKVSQRYVTTIVIVNGNDKMELENLDYTSPWKVISGNQKYTIQGLEASRLEHKDASNGVIRNAVSRSARANRYSKKEINEWEQLARKVISLNKPPMSIELQSVMWRIEGKDRSGKVFYKEVRIDLPI